MAVRAVDAYTRFVLEHRVLTTSVVLALLVTLAVVSARYKIFTCDEIYTLRIAQQPTLKAMLAVSRELDLHPPLHYLLARASLHAGAVLGLPVWLMAMLPDMLLMCAALLCMIAFVSRRLGFAYGLLAALAVALGPALAVTWSDRPYALWVGFLALLCVCWQRAAEAQRSAWWLLGVLVASTATLATHMGGMPCVLAFAVVEAIRWRRRRTPDWPLWVALFAPLSLSVLYLRQTTSFHQNSFAPAYMPSVDTWVSMYGGLIAVPLMVVVGAIAVDALLHVGLQKSAAETSRGAPDAGCRFKREEIALGVMLLVLPSLLQLTAALRTTQFFTRYGICGALGIAILLPVAVHRLARDARPAIAMALIGFVSYAGILTHDGFYGVFQPSRADMMGVHAAELATLRPDLPMVIARPTMFVEMNQAEPADLLHRVYYVYDRDAAREFSGSTVFEDIGRAAELLHFDAHTAPWPAFAAEHKQFVLIGEIDETEEWLPRYLIAHGDHVETLGRFHSRYADTDAWLVTLR
jgi:hypothetical protein